MAKYWIYSIGLVLTANLFSNTEVTLEERSLNYDPEVLWRFEDNRIISEYNGRALSVLLILKHKALAPRWRYDHNTSVILCVEYDGTSTVVKYENNQPYLALRPLENGEPQYFIVSKATPSANI
ncbi:13489_t:CDS:2 [Ambispora leptoticha]|uniref:13489_t:CDS:1 n=1 Tax=Ambispora leptoticha TaxID=144679 RepID=A0A9N9CW04_9GLOM|nr:13489_t:CDS:2 [Ambispora leptoticha]